MIDINCYADIRVCVNIVISHHRIRESLLSKSVFVSHATKDKELVAAIVDLIEDGIGVPESEIFCSSLDGYGILNRPGIRGGHLV